MSKNITPTEEDKSAAKLTAIKLAEAMFNMKLDPVIIVEDAIAQARREGAEAEREACYQIAREEGANAPSTDESFRAGVIATRIYNRGTQS